MPYDWIPSSSDTTKELHLWPHQSLPPKGYFRILLATAVLISLPLLPVLGTVVLWGLLPFLLLALFGLKWALDRNRRDHQILEILTLTSDSAQLLRYNPRGKPQSWQCNRYWVTVQLHKTDGPVPNYVTLRGDGREVEIGAFLSEDERSTLYDDLLSSLRAA
ncbi:MAG: hypothetical protein COB16_05110 [Rhodobacteraceae bacterium]|nr:MAG: hypothetical protein COB16_19720 [Paracoccaceae bacterium]PCJ09091.1 MAG: hypothetical protein COB16_05110 [Paracoccaceae bacterium]